MVDVVSPYLGRICRRRVLQYPLPSRGFDRRVSFRGGGPVGLLALALAGVGRGVAVECSRRELLLLQPEVPQGVESSAPSSAPATLARLYRSVSEYIQCEKLTNVTNLVL